MLVSMVEDESQLAGRMLGRYVLCSEIAAGGMATVHLGRLIGPGGFARTVAIKRLHPQFAKDPEFGAMFLDEARLAGRVRHPNVASVLDVVALEGELFLVMEFVLGESLARLLRNAVAMDEDVPIPVAVNVINGALRGLHAAHEATSETGDALNLVHRDVSPHNILVGVDGIARVVDFGIAKAQNRAQTTREGQLKGKLSYMAPEQVTRGRIDRRTDIYAASVVLWETLAGARLFPGDEAVAILNDIVGGAQDPPSTYRSGVSPELDAVVMRGLSRDPGDRYETARDMAMALENAVAPATIGQVGEWVEATAADAVRRRAQNLAEVESLTARHSIPPDMEGTDSGVRRQIADWDKGSSSANAGAIAGEADATVVAGTRRMASSPSIGTATGSLVPFPPRRRWTLSAAVGLSIAAGGVAMGLWLGRGQPSSTPLPGPPARAATLDSPDTTVHSDAGIQESSGNGLDVLGNTLSQTPQTAAPAADSEDAGADAAPIAKAPPQRSSRTGTKRYKGRARHPPKGEKKPDTRVDFDNLTRK